MNIYKHSKEFPYHISVGAVLLNDKNEVACEAFPREFVQKAIGIDKEIRTLVRETIEEGEDILTALHRGLQEEVGMTGDVLWLSRI